MFNAASSFFLFAITNPAFICVWPCIWFSTYPRGFQLGFSCVFYFISFYFLLLFFFFHTYFSLHICNLFHNSDICICVMGASNIQTSLFINHLNTKFIFEGELPTHYHAHVAVVFCYFFINILLLLLHYACVCVCV